MKNINYKIVTLILSGILIVTYAWHWEDVFNHKNKEGMSDMKMSGINMGNKKSSHMMQMPDGSMMEMSNDSTKMGTRMNMSEGMGDMTMNEMVSMMQGKTGKALEKEFLTGMIPHHKGAVEMAKLLLQDKTVNPEIRAFAENIIKAQDSEILVMNKWLKNY